MSKHFGFSTNFVDKIKESAKHRRERKLRSHARTALRLEQYTSALAAHHTAPNFAGAAPTNADRPLLDEILMKIAAISVGQQTLIDLLAKQTIDQKFTKVSLAQNHLGGFPSGRTWSGQPICAQSKCSEFRRQPTRPELVTAPRKPERGWPVGGRPRHLSLRPKSWRRGKRPAVVAARKRREQ